MKNAFLLSIVLLSATISNAQNRAIAGDWLGSLSIGVKLRLVLHVQSTAPGVYTGTLDSPDQGVKDIPASSVFVKGDSLHVGVDVIKGGFDGAFVNDTTVTGTWSQGPGKAAMTMVKTREAFRVSRPQTPKAPFSYKLEDVEYDNPDKSVHFGGTLTYPSTGSSFPAAILITGSGQQDRDETLFEHKPFAVIADYLTKQGFAVLRVDDRGIGKTKGEVSTATSADFARDVEAGLIYLKTRKEIDKKKIGLIGHSEGGIIAPMVAANNKEIAFIVLWGAPIVGGLEVNTEQNAYSLKKAGLSDASINAFRQLHRKELALFKNADDVTSLHKSVMPVFLEWRRQQPEAILKTLLVTDSSVVGQSVYNIYDGLFELPWMRFFINHNFKDDLAKVKCPVLAVNGENDTQIDASTNLLMIDSILKANHHLSFKTVSLKGLNHLLQTAETGDASEYKTIEQTIAPQALTVMGDWLQQNVQSK